ncbi:MAG: hypothetical protein AB7I50_22930 [Vicinamibacterales bacterium]
MLEIAATWFVFLLQAYAVAGFLFSAAVLPRHINQLDAGMTKAPAALRLLLVPGMTAFWPVFALRWLKRTSAPVERNAHRVLALRSTCTQAAGRRAEAPEAQ